MKRFLLFVFWFGLTLPMTAAAPPYIGYVYPTGMQRGGKMTLIVGGQNLNDVRVQFSGGGVTVEEITVMPGIPNVPAAQQKFLVTSLRRLEAGKSMLEWPDESQRSDWRECRLFDYLEGLTKLERDLVARGVMERRNPLQEAPSLRQLVLIELTVAPDAECGERSLRVWNRQGVSAPRAFFIDDRPHLSWPFYVPKYAPRAELPCAGAGTVLDGAIMPGERDLMSVRLEQDQEYTFALKGRYFQPFIGDAVPGHFQPFLRLFRPDGTPCAEADDEFFDPDPVLRVRAAESGVYKLEVSDNLWRGREDFVYRIEFEKGVRQPYFAPSVLGKKDVQTGVLRAGEVKKFSFQGRKGDRFAADLAARRCFSPLDGVFRLIAPSGALVAENDDRETPFPVGRIVGESDPELLVTLEENGTYTLELSDRSGKGGPDYRYYLRYGVAEPDFVVYTKHSALNIPSLGRIPLTFFVERREGFSGAVKIRCPELRFSGTIGAGKVEETLSIGNPFPPGSEPEEVHFSAEAELPTGERLTRAVVPAEVYLQAFAYDHLLPVHDFSFLSLRGGNRTPKTQFNGRAVKREKSASGPSSVSGF